MRFSAGVLVSFLIHLSMPFNAARAKYAFGYGRRFLSYVRAAFVIAKSPSLSRSSMYKPFCQPGRAWTKYLAKTRARS